MDDTRLQWTPDGLERFSQLEDKIFQAVEEIKAIRIENSRLNEQLNEQIKGNEALRGEIDGLKRDAGEYERLLGENDGLRQQIETMRQSETDMLETLAQFEKEREEILERAKKEREEMRDRVEKSLTLLASLEAQ
jgi:cell division septum initiation protein DivIVA